MAVRYGRRFQITTLALRHVVRDAAGCNGRPHHARLGG
jgi:hypothetical protein